MGKTRSSCFKIMVCGGGGGGKTDSDDSEMAEGKASPDRGKWSFRKRDERHGRLGNIVISEPLPVAVSNKENSEASDNSFHPPLSLQIPEKVPVVKFAEEMTPLSSVMANPSVSNSSPIKNHTTDGNYSCRESVAIVIQTAIRGYLAQKKIWNLKNIIKLQAAVRGHLVRRQAIGTLRCVQAIVKMQEIVRAHHRCDFAENLAKREVRKNSGTKQNNLYPSNGKLLKNGFACELLEARPGEKPARIICDPSKLDSTWKWLERWTAITSSDVEQKEKYNLNSKCQKHGGDYTLSVAVSKPDHCDSEVPIEGLNNFNSRGNGFDIQVPASTPDECFNLVTEEGDSCMKSSDFGVALDTCNSSTIAKEASNSSTNQTTTQPDITLQSPLKEKHVFDKEKSKRTTKRMVCGTLETEVKRSCNPAYASAQSKSEASSATQASDLSVSLDQKNPDEAKSDSFLALESFTKADNFSENSTCQETRIQTATSDCGTEISISSTRNSPTISGAEFGEITLQVEALEKRDDTNGDAMDVSNFGASNFACKKSYSSGVTHEQKVEEVDGYPDNSPSASVTIQAENLAANRLPQLENVSDQQIYVSSPEGSPRSQMTTGEAYGTPSSQISVKAKKNKTDKKLPAKMQRSPLTGKRSPSNANNGSDAESGKRRSSFGMAKSDHAEYEPRVSSGNSLPSYMKATESARAKVFASNSPKSSPDVHDNDTYRRKRHSLPIGNGMHGSSPRMQRSTSQVQQSAKRNTTHSPQNSSERKWQR